MTPPRPSARILLVLLAAVGLLAGCATVPGSSDVTVLRRLGDVAEPSAPPGPARDADPLEIVRGWVQASGSTTERHEAARGFLTAPAAGGWDDGATPVVVSDQLDTVYAGRPTPLTASVRVRATRLGTLSPSGAFVPGAGTLDLVVDLVAQDGQWRISALPAGTVVRRTDLHTNTRAVRTWFADTATGLPVAETRYLQLSPARSTPARALDLLAGGPSSTLAGAVTSALPTGAALRATDPSDVDGTLAVDAAGAGGLDPGARVVLARQVVLTLAGIGVPRVRLTADGAPLVPGRAELGVSDVLAGVPPAVRAARDLPLEGAADVSGVPRDAPLVTADGRVSRLGDPAGAAVDPIAPVTGAVSAAESGGGDLAVVTAGAGGARLLLGRTGTDPRTPAPVTLDARTLTPPSWAPTSPEVWTVADGARVLRVTRDAAGVPTVTPVDAAGLLTAGPITALALSPDGVRVAAVSGGLVTVGVVVRDPAGGVRVTSVAVLRAVPSALPSAVSADADVLAGVVGVAWSRSDQLVAVGGRAASPVSFLSVDGLDLDRGPTANLSPPVTAVAATPGQPVLVVDQGGVWSLSDDGSGVWRSVAGAAGAVPAYPG